MGDCILNLKEIVPVILVKTYRVSLGLFLIIFLFVHL